MILWFWPTESPQNCIESSSKEVWELFTLAFFDFLIRVLLCFLVFELLITVRALCVPPCTCSSQLCREYFIEEQDSNTQKPLPNLVPMSNTQLKRTKNILKLPTKYVVLRTTDLSLWFSYYYVTWIVRRYLDRDISILVQQRLYFWYFEQIT